MSTLQTASQPRIASRTGIFLAEMARCGQHAHREYTQAAQRMQADGLYVAAYALRYTAAQEKEQAAILRGLVMAGAPSPHPPADEPPEADAPGPLCAAASAESLLRQAAGRELHAARHALPQAAAAAREEGYHRAERALLRIAENEERHARRFLQYAAGLRDGTLFHAQERVGWLCLACGQRRCDRHAPASCPHCGMQGSHIRSDFSPFAVE